MVIGGNDGSDRQWTGWWAVESEAEAKAGVLMEEKKCARTPL
jgi:hypothetical protein